MGLLPIEGVAAESVIDQAKVASAAPANRGIAVIAKRVQTERKTDAAGWITRRLVEQLALHAYLTSTWTATESRDGGSIENVFRAFINNTDDQFLDI